MLSITSQSGYQESRYKELLGDAKMIILKGDGPQPVRAFDDVNKRYTDEVINQRVEVYYVGMGTQLVKLPPDFKFPSGMADMAEVKLVHPEACRVSRNIYVRAEGLQVIGTATHRGDNNG